MFNHNDVLKETIRFCRKQDKQMINILFYCKYKEAAGFILELRNALFLNIPFNINQIEKSLIFYKQVWFRKNGFINTDSMRTDTIMKCLRKRFPEYLPSNSDNATRLIIEYIHNNKQFWLNINPLIDKVSEKNPEYFWTINDELLPEAMMLVAEGVSTSKRIQERLGISAVRAKEIMKSLMLMKVISYSNKYNEGNILITYTEWLNRHYDFIIYLEGNKERLLYAYEAEKEANEYISSQKNKNNSQNDVLSIEYVDSELNGWEFEKYVKELLEMNGFVDVTVTPGSNDYGVDVLATDKHGVKYAIQCKKYQGKVDNTAVQEVYSSKSVHQCHVAVVLTNSTFTQNAINLAKANNVLLWDREKLIEMIQKARLNSANNTNDVLVKSAVCDSRSLDKSDFKSRTRGSSKTDQNTYDILSIIKNANAGVVPDKDLSASEIARFISDKDSKMAEAIEIVTGSGQASASMLQRRLNISYARAGRMIDDMEQMGIVGPHQGSKPRDVLMTYNEWLERNNVLDAPADEAEDTVADEDDPW